MKLGAGAGREWDFEAESHSGQDPSRLGRRRRTWKLALGPRQAPHLVSGRRCFGFRSRAPAKDLPLYSPDEGALGATGA